MSEQQRCVDVISKRQKRKQKTIILGITFFIVFIFMAVLSENNNTGFIFGITFLILLISLIWFVALIIKNIIDRIKNGSDKFLYIKLNEEGKELLRQQENKSKEEWYEKKLPFEKINNFPENNNLKNVTDIGKKSVKKGISSKNIETGCGIFVIVTFWTVLICIIVSFTRCTSDISNTHKNEDLTWFAQFACEKEIKARAIYPPSVKVHFRRDNYIKGNSYTVYGTVDSQNGFGAMMRQNFACEAIIDEANDKYWIKDLNIE